MNKLKILIVEGNTNDENINFHAAGCVPQSENFKLHVKKLEPNCDIEIVSPGDDQSISTIINSLKTSVILEALSSTANTGPKLGFKLHLIVT